MAAISVPEAQSSRGKNVTTADVVSADTRGKSSEQKNGDDQRGDSRGRGNGRGRPDREAPVVVVPANATVEATGPAGASFTYAASANDVEDGIVAVACAPASGSTFAFGATTVTCTATDAAGNAATASFTVTVADTAGPIVAVPGDSVVEATSTSGATFVYTVSASDVVNGSVLASCVPASGSVFAIGVTTVNCTASDAAGNNGTASFAVKVADTAGPSISGPGDSTVEATSTRGAAFTYTASANDVVDGSVGVTCTPASASMFPIGSTLVSCTATDHLGNNGSTSFTVTVTDTVPPVVTVPGDATIEAVSATGATFSYVASASDYIDGPRDVTCTPATGSSFPLGLTRVTCSAADTRGNAATASFTVGVGDTVGPVVSPPTFATLPATGTSTGGSSTGSSTDVGSTGGCTSVAGGAVGGTTGCQSTSGGVITNAEPGPIVTTPSDFTTNATSAIGAIVDYTVTASDAVDGNLTVNCTRPSGSNFPFGTTSVGCTATDTSGNSGSSSFTVTVIDGYGPTVTVPASFSVEATAPTGAVVTFSASAVDVVDGVVTVTCNPASGSTFALGAKRVSCTAMDTRRNTRGASFTVTVVDTTAPTVTVPASVTLEATGPGGAPFSYDVQATDIVSGAVTVTCTHPSGSTFPLGASPVDCTATDTKGNSRTQSFTVTVQDTQAPLLSVPADATVEATGPAGAPHTYNAIGTDLVDGAFAANCTPASGSPFPLGTTTVNCAATDTHGNASSSASFAVTVVDTTAPAITVPINPTVEATGPAGAVFNYTVSAQDAVSGSVGVSCVPATGGIFALGTTTITCSASDARGNGRDVSFTVTVQDTTPPTLSLPPDANLTTGDPTGTVFTYQAAAADLVDGGGNAPLVQSSNLIYEGGFRVPDGLFQGPNLTPDWQLPRAKFEYGGTAIAFNGTNNSLFVVGHDQAQLVAEISIPTLKSGVALGSLNTATVLQPFTDFTDQRMSLVSSDPLNPPDVTVKVGGLLPYQNQLFGSVYIYYDGRSSQKLTLFKSSLNLSLSGDAIGPFEAQRPDCNPSTNANCLGAGFYSGYFGRVPFEWQTQLGGPVLNGHCCLGVISRTSYGPALSTLDPAQIGTTTPVPAKPLVYYPPAHPLVEPGVVPCINPECNPFVDGWSENSTLFNGTSEVKGVVLPDGTRSVLFFGRHGGLGNRPDLPGGGGFCYGFGTGNPALVGTFPPGESDRYCYDPQDGSKGVHGYPYHYYVWAYDASDLAAVNAGQREPWSVRPYAVWPISIPFSDVGSTRLGGATFDPQSGRIYVSQYQADGNLPLIHAFKLEAIPRQASVTCAPQSGARFPVGATTVECSARDQAGNEATGSFTVSVTLTDTTAPVVTVPANAIVEATGPTGAAFVYGASATDNVDGPLATNCTPASGTTFPIGLTTVVCTATDAHANTGSASFTVTVRDTTAPALTVPSSTTIEAMSASGATFTFTTSALDIVDGSVTPVCSPASGSLFPMGPTIVNCTATDTRNNTSSANFTVTVRDTIAPVVTVPASFDVEATGATGAVVTFTASAVDNVNGARPTVCAPASGTTFPFGPTTVTCTATDTSSNTGTNSFIVTVRDTTPPALTVPPDATVEATSAAGAVFAYSATANDIVNGNITPTCTSASGTTFPIATTTVSCSATDTRGNTSNASFSVTVRDTTGPVLTIPANATVEATGPAGASYTYSASAIDAVDGARTISCVPTGAPFAIGVTTVNCSAADTRGNSSQASFTVTVRDTTAPVVTVPANATISASSGAGAAYTFSTTATDIVDGNLPVSCSRTSGSTFPIGTTTVTCTATDAHNNIGTGSFTVTVLDGAGPIVTVPANATVEATGSSGAVFTFSASAVDAIDGPRPVSCTPASGSTFPLGPNTVTCSSVDTQGNPGSASFTVTVVDTTPPNVTVPANATLEATTAAGALFTYSATAIDLVDGSRPVNCTPASGTVFPIAVTTVNCTASDTRGNVRLAPFTVTVRDTSAPTITMTAPVNGGNVSGNSVTVSAVASDAVGLVGVQFMVDGVPVGLEDTTSPFAVVWNTTTAPNGSHSVFAVARDAVGNVRTALSMTVNVNNAPGSVAFTVDGNAKRQVVDGFIVNANSAPWNNGALIPILDMLVDQGGSIYRVIVDKMDWEATNDNSDPFTFNWAYYNTIYSSPKFENFWNTIAYLNSKGITNGILLNFMGPGPNWIGQDSHITPGLEDEWVETVASLLYYARFNRGLQFTQVGPSNEVDWDGIEGPRIDQWQYAVFLQKLAERLDAIGLGDIQLVGPDTASVVSGVNDYLPQLLANPTAMSKIQHFGFHNYGDNAAGADAEIKSSAYPNRDFWMTEASFGNDYYGVERLMAQLENGAAAVGVWDAYESVYNHRPNDSQPMLDLVGGQYVPLQSFYVYKTLFKFVPPGATRLQTASTASVDSVAFFDTVTRRVTVFGHAHTGGTVRIALTNLPMVSSYQVYYTSHTTQFERQPDVTLVNGVAVLTNIDGDGYFTLTGLAAPLTDTAAPTVTITSPANGATVVGSLTLTAAASDDVAVAGVQFQLDGVNLGAEITSPPFTTSWNSMNASNGAHLLTAIARDSSGKTTTSAAVSITINNDLTPPTVSITTPINGASVAGTAVAIIATASDNVGVVGVQFRLNGANFGTEFTAPPYSVTWNTTLGLNGAYTWTAVARDAAGNSTISTAINVTVNNLIDTTAPTVSITAPVGGATLTGTTVTLSANASDNVGVIGVQFLVDGVAVGVEDTSAPYSIAWDSTSVANGAHTISARARDSAGNQQTSAAVSVDVSNTAAPATLAVDAQVFGILADRGTSITSPAFSTASTNQVVVVFLSFDDLTPGNGTTAMTGGGLTWTMVARQNARRGGVEVWRAYAANRLTNATVTATITQPTPATIAVVSFTGADTSGTNASGAIGAVGKKSGTNTLAAANVSVTTTRANSWVWGVGNDWDGDAARTVPSDQTLLHQYLYWGGATLWTQRRNTTTPTVGSAVQINVTAPTSREWNMIAVEIKPRP